MKRETLKQANEIDEKMVNDTVEMSRIQAFQRELETLINKYNIENECDMPDFLLSEMVVRFITAVGNPIKKTLDWHGCDSVCHPTPYVYLNGERK